VPDIRAAFEDRFPVPEGIEWRNTDYFPIHTENVHEFIGRCGRASRYADMWQAWQASRAALKVELPRPYGPSLLDIDPDFEQYNRGIRDCKEALQQAGIEVK